ncbi:MAG: homocysteine S-methyltransferase [Gemmatales bacterium]|nr:MAG: homocysteine S-methyltransferase [Gemmatales bacterium]
MSSPDEFRKEVATSRLLLLDGATGTELMRRGVDTGLPLWSAKALIEAPETVFAIHKDYVAAGAAIITANTFRTHRRSLAKAGLGFQARELTRLAVSLARQACEESGAYVAGSLAPLEDCYRPDLVPTDQELRQEHREMAHNLADAGVDLILVETMNTIREAVAAVSAANATGVPVVVSFVCKGATSPEDHADWHSAALFSGESLAEAVQAVAVGQPVAILLNCIPVRSVEPRLQSLASLTEKPIGAYANVGHVDEKIGWTLTNAVTPEEYAAAARKWYERGASIIGGCCGTTPEHIAALHRTFFAERRS